MHAPRVRTVSVALFSLLAAGTAVAQRRTDASRACLSADALARRRVTLEQRDQRAIDAAVAGARPRAGLADLSVTPVDRAVGPAPGSPPTRLPPGVTLRSSRVLDSTGANVETRVSSDGRTQIFVAQALQSSDACGRFDRRPDDFRFARDAAGRVVPIHIVFREIAVHVVECGCGYVGCGMPSPRRGMIREFELPVRDESEVGPSVTVRVDRHDLASVGSRVCPPPP
jgi:hypothetical protein